MIDSGQGCSILKAAWYHTEGVTAWSRYTTLRSQKKNRKRKKGVPASCKPFLEEQRVGGGTPTVPRRFVRCFWLRLSWRRASPGSPGLTATPLPVEAAPSAVFSQTTALREKLQTPRVFQQKHRSVVQARADRRVFFCFFFHAADVKAFTI